MTNSFIKIVTGGESGEFSCMDLRVAQLQIMLVSLGYNVRGRLTDLPVYSAATAEWWHDSRITASAGRTPILEVQGPAGSPIWRSQIQVRGQCGEEEMGRREDHKDLIRRSRLIYSDISIYLSMLQL